MSSNPIRIGTRPSQLARWQANWVAARIDAPTEVTVIRTQGDDQRDRRFEEFGIQGIFTKELEIALVDRRVDIAVHSLKDMPTALPPQLALSAVTERVSVQDVLMVHPDACDPGHPLPVRRPGKVGTSSQRRAALLSAFGQGLTAEPLRGNVPTRVNACREGRYDAILLARAGVERLSVDTSPLKVFVLRPDPWTPAPGQAALALETRADDADSQATAALLNHLETRLCTAVERAMLAHFATGCHAPFAAWSTITDETLHLRLGISGDGGPWKSARLDIPVAELHERKAVDLPPADLASALLSEHAPGWSNVGVACATSLCDPWAPASNPE